MDEVARVVVMKLFLLVSSKPLCCVSGKISFVTSSQEKNKNKHLCSSTSRYGPSFLLGAIKVKSN